MFTNFCAEQIHEHFCHNLEKTFGEPFKRSNQISKYVKKIYGLSQPNWQIALSLTAQQIEISSMFPGLPILGRETWQRNNVSPVTFPSEVSLPRVQPQNIL